MPPWSLHHSIMAFIASRHLVVEPRDCLEAGVVAVPDRDRGVGDALVGRPAASPSPQGEGRSPKLLSAGAVVPSGRGRGALGVAAATPAGDGDQGHDGDGAEGTEPPSPSRSAGTVVGRRGDGSNVHRWSSRRARALTSSRRRSTTARPSRGVAVPRPSGARPLATASLTYIMSAISARATGHGPGGRADGNVRGWRSGGDLTGRWEPPRRRAGSGRPVPSWRRCRAGPGPDDRVTSPARTRCSG